MGGGAVLALGLTVGASVRAADAPAAAPAPVTATPVAVPATGVPGRGVNAPGPAAAAPAPPATTAQDAAYDPTGRRDPFRPPRVNQLLVGGSERTPLQRYELGQLRLVAVIYDTGDPRAVVEDEGGLGYIIKVGTKIGVNDGVVRGIERGRVLVEEESVDFFGERRSAEVVLEMASGERGNR
jgi:type IV pilus assembly protein PilP